MNHDVKVVKYSKPSRYEPSTHIHIIVGNPTTNYSLSSLLLLTDYYRLEEAKFWSKKLNIDISDWEGSNYSILKELSKIFCGRFLEKNFDKLICEYCGKEGLIFPNKKKQKHNTVTIDHRIPMLEECDWFDESNLAICCYDCNNKKGNKSVEIFMKKLTNISHKKDKKD